MVKTKKAIFDAAIKIFSQSGYDGATMDDISIEAGVAKGTLYYHFKSKEEIFKFIIDEGMKEFNEELKISVDREDDTLDKFRTLCRVQLNLVYNNRDFFKVVMSQLWGKELRQFQLRETMHEYIRYIETYVKDAMNKGIIKQGDPSFIAFTIFGNICSSAVYELLTKVEININNVIDNLIEVTADGIATKKIFAN